MKSIEQLYNQMKEIQDSKDMDEIGAAMMDLVTLYGLKMNEVAALCYFVTERTLKAPHNSEFIKNHFSIDVDRLGIDGMLQIQRALVVTYLEQRREEE